MFQYVFLWHFLSLINLFLLYDCIFPSERYENDYCEGLQCFYMYQLPFSFLVFFSLTFRPGLVERSPDKYSLNCRTLTSVSVVPVYEDASVKASGVNFTVDLAVW